ncbi:hypothetical protein SAMN05216480_11916 [Pustulibacterium marinum]|uniref:Uncharacterized protein n=1 Tax=Pustulibacterium marinum TaxID=1224947 RepID=A0A1I7IPT6_9FLAO|nr:hypothetical protein [Pustulibacterium marinum]SFU74959.1 hypothetical protein SAMN05216480_11916 [Pustulibacterium marinum]
MPKHYFFLIFSITSLSLHSQTASLKVQKMVNRAKDSLNVGSIEASFKLLNSAEKLAPKNKEIQFEKAYVYYVDTQYDKSIEILKNLLEVDSTLNENYYVLLGNSYDLNHESDSAVYVYKKGISKFPNSGRLRYENGVVAYGMQQYNKAVLSWEEGVKKDPMYADNYYMLAKTMNFTQEKIWVLLYGELFMNLEQNTERTSEISKLLFETYRANLIKSKNNKRGFYLTKSLAENSNQTFEAYFNQLLNEGITEEVPQRKVTIQDLYILQNEFLKRWYTTNNPKFDFVLLNYQKELQENGLLEAYTYWLLSEGNFEEFDAWMSNPINSKKMENLSKYVIVHPLQVKPENSITRKDFIH